MNAQRKKPDTLSGVAPEATPRDTGVIHRSGPLYSTIIPSSEAMIPPSLSLDEGEPNLLDLDEYPTSPQETTSDSNTAVYEFGSSEADAGPSWKTLLGIEERPSRPKNEVGAQYPATECPATETRSARPGPKESAGYYSTRPEPEFVGSGISSGPHSERAQLTSARPGVAESEEGLSTRRSIDSVQPEELGPSHLSAWPQEAPPPSSVPTAQESSPTHVLTSVSLAFPAHIRLQADGWLKSGSLSLPNSSSPRHARAMQRALLLALLASPGYVALPLGLKQRVGWLLSPGWESVPGGASYGELSDLLTVLGLPSDAAGRRLVLSAAEVLIPSPLPSGRPPSSYPPARR